MPHMYNADRRNKIPKQKHRVTNWAEYNEGLRRRGDMTVWISDVALGLWSAPRRTTRGGQPRYGVVTLKDYPGATEPGILDPLDLSVDMTVTNSFSPVDDVTA